MTSCCNKTAKIVYYDLRKMSILLYFNNLGLCGVTGDDTKTRWSNLKILSKRIQNRGVRASSLGTGSNMDDEVTSINLLNVRNMLACFDTDGYFHERRLTHQRLMTGSENIVTLPGGFYNNSKTLILEIREAPMSKLAGYLCEDPNCTTPSSGVTKGKDGGYLCENCRSQRARKGPLKTATRMWILVALLPVLLVILFLLLTP